MTWLAWLIATGIALFALDRLLLAAEARGWIYWRRRRRVGSGGDVMVLDLMTNPAARHVVEAREDTAAEERRADDPP